MESRSSCHATHIVDFSSDIDDRIGKMLKIIAYNEK